MMRVDKLPGGLAEDARCVGLTLGQFDDVMSGSIIPHRDQHMAPAIYDRYTNFEVLRAAMLERGLCDFCSERERKVAHHDDALRCLSVGACRKRKNGDKCRESDRSWTHDAVPLERDQTGAGKQLYRNLPDRTDGSVRQ